VLNASSIAARANPPSEERAGKEYRQSLSSRLCPLDGVE
jgi:hypothetical protein